jgi:hypothetical protein
MENKLLGTEWLVEQLRNGKELNDDLINEANQIEQSNLIVPKKVLIKDYEKDVNYLMLAMRGVNISVDYVTADLIIECIKMVKSKGGDSSLLDMVEIKHKHNKKWKEYFDNLDKENE